jgi:CBS-domain-containing membrane protein
MDGPTKRERPDRSKINMERTREVKYWTHALAVTREELQAAVDKVGNSAATVRKQLKLTAAAANDHSVVAAKEQVTPDEN